MSWLKTRHGGQAIRESKQRVRAEMIHDLNELVTFAESNDLRRIEQVWCSGCQVYHEKWSGHGA